MSWDTIFLLANYWAFAGWIALASLPRSPKILAAILYAGVLMLCLAYTAMIVGFLTGSVDAGGPGGGDFSTLAGVMKLFDSPGGATLGWTHYLAFDLFTGLWIARDADNKGFGRIVQLPFLFLTLMVGPVGLLAWLIVRERRARAQSKAKALWSSSPWMPGDGGAAVRRHAPATLRNRDAITAVLADWLPASGTVLEVASGSGEHVVHFAAAFPELHWQPSDPDPAGLISIGSYRAEAARANIAPPLALDASAPEWPIGRADAILCINMVHISPWEATIGLFAGAARQLAVGAPLILYGPYVEPGVPTAASNAAFDASLRTRNPAWGLRDIEAVKAAAAAAGLCFTERRAMPANNLMLLFRRT